MKTLLSLVGAAAFAGAASIGAAAPSVTDNGEYSIEFVGQSANGAFVDFSWQICKLDAAAPGLNHATFALDFSSCAPGVPLEAFVVSGSVTQGAVTDANVLLFWTDPDTTLTGVSFTGLQWLDDSAGACYIFTLTLDPAALPPGVTFGAGPVDFATRAGVQSLLCPEGGIPGFATTLGPVCAPDEEGPREGLTPGYWKNHRGNWPAPFAPTTTVAGAGFVGSLYQTTTLAAALDGGGGSGVAGAQKILLRAATAALLNAAATHVNYPLTVAEVLAQTNAALATGNRAALLALADTLDAYNNLGLSD
jgi:hypothetical protein